MPKPRVKMSSAGARALLRDPGVRAELHNRAERVKSAAEASAPYDSRPGRGDDVHFRDSFRVVDTTTDRAVARVVTVDPLGAVKEARFRTLTNALDAAR